MNQFSHAFTFISKATIKVDMIKPYVKGLPTENVMNTWYAKDMYIVKH